MIASLSEQSIKQYDSCLKKWFNYCNERNISFYQTSSFTVIEFLTQLFHNGAQYATLNTCRSALSLLLGSNIGKHEHITRFFKGIFRLRPPMPKYNATWDTAVVLNFLEQWHPNETLSLEKISKKLITLFALSTAHRMQTFSKIHISNIQFSNAQVLIKIVDLIKTSRIGSLQPILILPVFSERVQICPVAALKSYLDKTKNLRNNQDYLFISIRRPHGPVSSQTLARWVKETLRLSGVDVSIFSAHSTRHAATSRAHDLGVNLDSIRKAAGWSGSSKTFGKFYHRMVVDCEDDSFATSILRNRNNNC